MLVAVVAVAALVAGAGTLVFGRRHRYDDVQRFHRARGITTGWARAALTQPVPQEEREPANTH